jgi:hypothetical protein
LKASEKKNQSENDDEDSDEDEYTNNERKNMQRSILTIFPESSFKTGWDLVGFVFIVIQSIVIPFNICFNVNPTGGLKVVDGIIDVFFMIDISKRYI